MNHRHQSIRRQRAGFSSLEVVVAFTLLTAALGLAVPLVVAHHRLVQAQRHYRVALAEISNQIERLSLLPIAELPAAVEKLEPSEFAADRLPGATLRGTLRETDFGRQVTLEVSWDETNRQAAPVRLTTWLFAEEAAP